MNDIINGEMPYFENDSFFKSGEQVYIHLSTEFPKFVGVMHKHQFIEIVYILSGEAIHNVGNKQYEVKCGDVTVINCGVPHKFTSKPDSKENFVAYDLMFTPDFFEASAIKMSNFESLKNSFLFYSLFPTDSSAQPDLYISGKRYSDYGEIFTRIYHEFGRCEKGYIELIRAYVIELIIKMFRDMEKTEALSLTKDKTDTLNSAIRYIEDNYNTKLSIDEIAAKVFLSSDYFRKLFKRVTGDSVLTFQQKLRISEARKLLQTTDIPIKDISLSIGYNDIKSFYQAFKKVTGQTPKEYRNNQ